jgi:hypothetical protein
MQFEEGYECVIDLVQDLQDRDESTPVYAETPHGSFWFKIKGLEDRHLEGEDVVVLKLYEVKR